MKYEDIIIKLTDLDTARLKLHNDIMEDRLEGIDVSDLVKESDKIFKERKDFIKTHLATDIEGLRTIFDGHITANTEDTVRKVITYKHQTAMGNTAFKACIGHLIRGDKCIKEAFQDVGDFQGIAKNWVEYRRNIIDSLPD